MRGYLYLLHFDSPISENHTCQHYLGWTQDLASRIQAHRLGYGARLTAVAKERGIRFTVARIWRAERSFERTMKRRKASNRYCPICGHHHELQEDERAVEVATVDFEYELIAF